MTGFARGTVFLCILFLSCAVCLAQNMDPYYYQQGEPDFIEYYVDPVSGSDSSDGRSLGQPFRTLTRGWNAIPSGSTLSTGVRINLLSGTYPEESIPNYLEERYGTSSAPIVIRALNGRGTAILGGDLNVFDTKYLYLIDLVIRPSPAGDAFHCEQCDHILLKNSVFDGGNQEAHETIKINQSQNVYIEDCDISGAGDNAVDFVAVQYGHIVNSQIHNANDWCAYVKGGSAYIRVEGNRFYDCGTGGFTAGQGTGFEFMTAPWIHYEAYDIKVINNIIHDTEGAGLGVNGGYNILLAHNTLYRVGSRSHTLEVVFGLRSCDGNTAACQSRIDLGGWGVATVGPEQMIGNKNVFVLNNLIYNPSGFRSEYQHFAIYGPLSSLAGSNYPGNAESDQNLVIKGNIISDGPLNHPIGVGGEDGCKNSNTTCNQSQILSDNVVNQVTPQLRNPSALDFRPIEGSNIFSNPGVTLADFAGGDRVSTPLAPVGNLQNLVTRDRSMAENMVSNYPGAYQSATSTLLPEPPSVTEPVSISSIKIKRIKKKGKKVVIRVVARVVGDILSVGGSTTVRGVTKSISLSKNNNRWIKKVSVKTPNTFLVALTATDSGAQTASREKSFNLRRN